MCAINGFIGEDLALLERMNRATAHRGPDGTGVWCNDGVSLGHNRLAIIELSAAGSQPMESANGSHVITYNGEIYNFEELRKEAGPYAYRGASDTEVILAAYDRWGKDAFNKLNGIFAFALWDRKSKELLLVRDRAGVKPLYYYYETGRLIFSSEIKAILEHDVPRTLNKDGLLRYLRVQYVPGEETLFAGIRKLAPGHMLVYKNGTIKTEPYATEAPDTGSVSDEGLRETVMAAVTRQLVSDRPVGVYLSGGFDSAVVLAGARAAQPAIDTFSVGFDMPGHKREAFFNADMILARRTAAHFGSTHHEFVLQERELAALFEDMIWHMDEPVSNATALPMLYLAKQAKRRVAVVLGGEGGDELFGGYERYRLSLLSSYYRGVPGPLRALLNHAGSFSKLDTPAGVERFARFMFQKDAELSRALAHPHNDTTRQFFYDAFFTPTESDFERQFMDTDRRSWLVDEALVRTDKMAMAEGLEVRVPLLDNEVVRYASRIPTEEKVTLLETKKMLKRAFKGVLPSHLYGEEKRGWFSPGGEWIKGGTFGALIDEVLSPGYYKESVPLFDWENIRTMLTTHRNGEEYHMVILWSLLVVQAWMRRYNVRV